jgi:hypothetical protein
MPITNCAVTIMTGATAILLGLGLCFSLLIICTVSRIPWTWDQPFAIPLPAHRTTQTQTSMPRVGFEHKTPVFEWTKERAATVLG